MFPAAHWLTSLTGQAAPPSRFTGRLDNFSLGRSFRHFLRVRALAMRSAPGEILPPLRLCALFPARFFPVSVESQSDGLGILLTTSFLFLPRVRSTLCTTPIPFVFVRFRSIPFGFCSVLLRSA